MAFIKGFGAFVPARVVGNDEMSALTGSPPDWIQNVSGITERRFAAEGESVADMALAAASDCLSRCRLQPSEVGMILVASGTAERRFPGPALSVAHRLGLTASPALDIPLPSAGSIIALSLAAKLASGYGNILVVGAEKMSTVVTRPPVEPGIAVLFGDGAGACVVSDSGGAAEIIDSAFYTDGAFADDLRLDLDGPLKMNGRSVIMQASRKIPRVIQEVLDRNSVAPGAVDTFVMHQANQNLIDGVAKALGVPSARFYSNIRRYGNTSAASMLIAASEWSEAGGLQPGRFVVFAGFGAGFHWGSLLARGV